MTIRMKIMVLVGCLLGGSTLIAITGLVGTTRLAALMDESHDNGFIPAENVLSLHKHLYKLRGDIYKLLLMADEKDRTNKDIAKDFQRIDSTLAALDSMSPGLTDSLQARVRETREAAKTYQAAATSIVDNAMMGNTGFGVESMKGGEAHDARKTLDSRANALLAESIGEVERIDRKASDAGRLSFAILLALSVFLIALGVAGSLMLARQIIKPIDRMVDELESIGEGDFRSTAERRMDGEIGRMVRGLENARSKLRQAFQAVRSGSGSISEMASTQRDATVALAKEADENEREAQSAAAATEEASTTLKTISDGAKHSMAGLESVSAAIEEMAASVTEIARSADETRAMTRQAMEGARSANSRMVELAAASKEIENVIELIVEISEQTKLLALNASIEAARAGESGRGFAVVAGEVKELAKGTAEATEDIRKRVEAMRATTGNAVAEIAQVTSNMEVLGSNIASIAGAVEQQSATTKEIARNIGNAVHGNREITRNLDAGSTAVSEIARDIQNVLLRGRTLREIAIRTEELASNATSVSQELNSEMLRFKT